MMTKITGSANIITMHTYTKIPVGVQTPEQNYIEHLVNHIFLCHITMHIQRQIYKGVMDAILYVQLDIAYKIWMQLY